jgi:site-specific recombinase XerD
VIFLSEIEIVKNSHSLPSIEIELSEDAKQFILESQAKNTRRAYLSDLNEFDKYLKKNHIYANQVNGNVIANYLTHLAKNGCKVSTIQRRLVAIRALFNHIGEQQIEEAKKRGEKDFEYHNPANSLKVKNAMKGIRRNLGVAPKQKKAATREVVKAILSEMGDSLIDIRNKAIISLGFAGAFRRSELAALDVDDIEDDSDGIRIRLKRSKTNQEGREEAVYIYYAKDAATCPVRLLSRWLRESGITEGAVFRRIHGKKIKDRLSDRSIAEVIKSAAEKAGFNKEDFSGHSLRRGFVTTMADDGEEERDIMRHTRHKSVITLRRYIEQVDIKKNNPTKNLW